MLIELIFKGSFINLDFNLLRNLIKEADEIYFVCPEISSIRTFDEAYKVFQLNTYVDFVIKTNHLHIDQKNVERVFINIGRNNDDIDFLFFFDLKDINEGDKKRNLMLVRQWMAQIQKKYNFQYFICQMDNANNDEYYFDSNGVGRLYKELDN